MILNLLKALASKFWKAYKQAMFNIIVGKLESSVLSIVNNLKGVDLSDADKRNKAFAEIKSLAIGAGKDIKDNAIHQAISLAIDILKGV